MSSTFDYDMSDPSDFILSFLVDIGKTLWFQGEEREQKKEDFLNEDFKSQIPRNKIFRINSLIFNLEKHQKELLSEYDCYYNEEANSLSIIFSEKINYADFTKEIMMNLLEFAQKVKIEQIYFLISRKNKQYARILQDLMIVGFETDENNKTAVIEGSVYKVLRMEVCDYDEEIEIEEIDD